MKEFPQLERAIIRAEDQPGYEKEIWQPTWNCFCCQDTGIVRPYLVRLVIKNYNWDTDKLPICNKAGCNKAPQPSEEMAHMYDCRLPAKLCEQLDQFAREDWKQTIKFKHEILQQLADSKSLRSRARTQEEENMVQEKKRMLG